MVGVSATCVEEMFQGEYVALVRFVKDRAQRSSAAIRQKGNFGCFSSPVRRISSCDVSTVNVLHKARIHGNGASGGISLSDGVVKHVLKYTCLRPQIEVMKDGLIRGVLHMQLRPLAPRSAYVKNSVQQRRRPCG